MEPWSKERQDEMRLRIDLEASLAAARLGATSCVLIAFYPDPEGGHLHIMDGGNAPMPRTELYPKLAEMLEAVEQRAGVDRLQ